MIIIRAILDSFVELHQVQPYSRIRRTRITPLPQGSDPIRQRNKTEVSDRFTVGGDIAPPRDLIPAFQLDSRRLEQAPETIGIKRGAAPSSPTDTQTQPSHS